MLKRFSGKTDSDICNVSFAYALHASTLASLNRDGVVDRLRAATTGIRSEHATRLLETHVRSEPATRLRAATTGDP